jgi:hypothetical protein
LSTKVTFWFALLSFLVLLGVVGLQVWEFLYYRQVPSVWPTP